MKKFLAAFLLLISFYSNAQVYSTKQPLVHTFSIVARDEKTGEMAVGVQSHWFAWALRFHGPKRELALLPRNLLLINHMVRKRWHCSKGLTPQQALDSLTKADAGRDVRQVAIIDKRKYCHAYR
jgi:hypothetical protein